MERINLTAENFSITPRAIERVRVFLDEAKSAGLYEKMPYSDVAPIIAWHRAANGGNWGYGNGVALDSLAKLERNSHVRQIILRDLGFTIAIWVGPDVQGPGQFEVDFTDGQFSIGSEKL